MTTVFQLAGEPRIGTHVLIVGVGSYTHLHGGAQPAGNTRGLGQLSSPPVSAKALLDWFLAPQFDAGAVGFRNSDSPLASVEALIAAPAPVTVTAPAGDVKIDGATLDEVRDAFERWRGRLISCPGNTGIFYFCGHGMSSGVQYALCQDLLRNEGVPYEKAFDVDGTLLTLGKEAQDCHIHFWFDACREVPAELLLTPNGRPFALRETPATNETIERSHSLLQATGPGKLAFAKTDKPSRFTTALLRSLSGYAGSSKYGGPWRVDASELSNAIKALLADENKSAERTQSSAFSDWGEGTAIVELLGPPKVKVSLDVMPDEMRADASVYLHSRDGGHKTEQECSKGALVTEVLNGAYNLGAMSASGKFPPSQLVNEWINPPLYDHKFKVVP